jgi:hypothetical protein
VSLISDFEFQPPLIAGHLSDIAGGSQPSISYRPPMDPMSGPGPSVPSLILPSTSDPTPRSYHLASTQDLISRFNLLPAYDKYVRPQIQQPDSPDPSEDKKKRSTSSYKHLIKQIPGKHSMKKDDYLVSIMQAPPKDRVPILPFDARTLRDAFTVSPEPLKGVSPFAH